MADYTIKPTIKGISFKQNEGFAVSYDNNILLEHVGRIIMTDKGERINNPSFGSNLKNYLFLKGNVLNQYIEKDFTDLIERYEPRVSVRSARLDYKGHEAKIEIVVVRRDNNDVLTFEEYLEI